MTTMCGTAFYFKPTWKTPQTRNLQSLQLPFQICNSVSQDPAGQVKMGEVSSEWCVCLGVTVQCLALRRRPLTKRQTNILSALKLTSLGARRRSKRSDSGQKSSQMWIITSDSAPLPFGDTTTFWIYKILCKDFYVFLNNKCVRG